MRKRNSVHIGSLAKKEEYWRISLAEKNYRAMNGLRRNRRKIELLLPVTKN